MKDFLMVHWYARMQTSDVIFVHEGKCIGTLRVM